PGTVARVRGPKLSFPSGIPQCDSWHDLDKGDAPRPSGRLQQPKREGSNVNGSSRHETKSFTTRGKKWSISFLVLGEFALTQKGRLDNTLFGMSIWRDNETG
ncbi:hypothetical protein PO909_022935, partial [Leuciscus waleckii]